MKLDQLAAAETTTFELLLPHTDEPTGVFVTAHTPDSTAWAQAEKKHAIPGKKQSLILGKGKDDGHRIEIDDATSAIKKKVTIAMVTNITGIDDFEFSKANAEKLLNEPRHDWMYEQLATHLGDRANYFLESKKTVKPTAKA